MTDRPDDDIIINPDDPSFLILATYRSHRQILDYPESRVVKANCGHHAWLSPQGEEQFERSYTVCLDCSEELLKDPDGPRVAVPGSLEAVRRIQGPDAERKARALMQKMGIVEQKGAAFRRPPDVPH